MPATSRPLFSNTNVLCVIMGGGQGSRLFPLTRDRSKPAVPLAGKYRLVDIPISNCINSAKPEQFFWTTKYSNHTKGKPGGTQWLNLSARHKLEPPFSGRGVGAHGVRAGLASASRTGLRKMVED